MRRLVLRGVLIAAVPLMFISPPNAEAKKDLPGGCDLFANTMCHCIGPGVVTCLGEPID